MRTPLLTATAAGVITCALLTGAQAAPAQAQTEATTASTPTPTALNVVTGGTFEPNDDISSKRSFEYFGASSTAHMATETVDGAANTYAVIDTGAIDGHIWQAVPTTPGTTYVVSADVKVGSAASTAPSSVFLTAKGQKPDGTQNQAATTQLDTASLADATTWTRKTFTFTAVNWKTYVGIVKWAASDADTAVANTTIAMDNLSVTEQTSYDLVWSDEFDGDALDQSAWGYELGNVRGNEQQHYSSSTANVDVTDGNLVLTATDRAAADQYRNTARWGDNARLVKYDSGSVRTEGREEFLYGRIEASIKMPEGKGAFPAFWMLGADFHLDGRVNQAQGYSWPSTGELDITEMIGSPTSERAAQGETGKAGNSNSVSYGTPHFYYTQGDGDGDGSYAPSALGGNITTATQLSDDYHVYGIDWNEDYIAWYVDGVVFNTMYFPTDATEAADNRAFVASEVARFQAAADSLNRPQYLQFNLATGGNWAGDAGDHLGEDGTSLTVDWVRYYRSAAQQASADAYYADQPVLTGAENVLMRAGEAADLVSGVSTDAGYHVDYSIDDEPMFVNGGAAGGRNEVQLVVDGATDTAALQGLAPGVYALHYSALADGVDYTGGITPTARVARKTVYLTVLPAAGLTGTAGGTLASVTLPAGWSWTDPSVGLGSADAYAAVFTQAADTAAPETRRTITVDIPAAQISVPEPAVAFTAAVTARCVGHQVKLVTTVTNGEKAKASFTVATGFGTKTVRNVKGGASSTATVVTHTASLDDATVSVTATVGGSTASREVLVDDITCG